MLGSRGAGAVHLDQVFLRESNRRVIARAMVCTCVCSLGLTRVASAEPPPLGPGLRAAPGYFRVPVVAAAPLGLMVAGGVGYGFTEAQSEARGGHHRTQGRFGVGLTPLAGFDVSMETHLRHDLHGEDAWGTDSGTVLDSDLHLAWGKRVEPGLHLGAGLGAQFVRSDTLASSLESPALEAQLLLAYLPELEPFSVGLALGYRYDRTRGTVHDFDRYRAGDRLALGVSEFDAVPIGLGGGYRLGATDLVAELSADVLVGSGAPGLTTSPLRATAGARYRTGDRLVLSMLADTALSKRPEESAAVFVPVEPRIQLMFGLAYQLFDWEPAPVSEPHPISLPARSEVAVGSSSIVVNVTTHEGHPLTDATVEIVTNDGELIVPHKYRQSYALERVPAREATLRVRASRLETYSRPILLEPGVPLAVDVQLQPAPPTGQVRGLVRSFGGRALRATVRIEPLGQRLETDEAGTFALDVPPGRYDVVVEAPGHERQRRTIEVASDGVVILNADLARGRP